MRHFLVIFTISEMVLLNSDLLYLIFDYLSMHQVSEMRIVCTFWKDIGEMNINKRWNLIKDKLDDAIKELRVNLPRRLSLQENHPSITKIWRLEALKTKCKRVDLEFIDRFSLYCGKLCDEIRYLTTYILSLENNDQNLTKLNIFTGSQILQ